MRVEQVRHFGAMDLLFERPDDTHVRVSVFVSTLLTDITVMWPDAPNWEFDVEAGGRPPLEASCGSPSRRRGSSRPCMVSSTTRRAEPGTGTGASSCTGSPRARRTRPPSPRTPPTRCPTTCRTSPHATGARPAGTRRPPASDLTDAPEQSVQSLALYVSEESSAAPTDAWVAFLVAEDYPGGPGEALAPAWAFETSRGTSSSPHTRRRATRRSW